MRCPNCRVAENGEWLSAEDDTSVLDMADNRHADQVHTYSYHPPGNMSSRIRQGSPDINQWNNYNNDLDDQEYAVLPPNVPTMHHHHGDHDDPSSADAPLYIDWGGLSVRVERDVLQDRNTGESTRPRYLGRSYPSRNPPNSIFRDSVMGQHQRNPNDDRDLSLGITHTTSPVDEPTADMAERESHEDEDAELVINID